MGLPDHEKISLLIDAIMELCVDFVQADTEEASIQNSIMVNALGRSLACAIVQIYKTDAEALQTMNQFMPQALAEERKYLREINPRLN